MLHAELFGGPYDGEKRMITTTEPIEIHVLLDTTTMRTRTHVYELLGVSPQGSYQFGHCSMSERRS